MRETSRDWYETVPAEGAGPGVLLLHSAWGLTDCYRRMCDRLAARGFYVVAPDLFDGATASTWEEAQLLRSRRRTSDRWSAIERATSHLRRATGRSRTIGTVGFSMGGHWALFLAERPDVPVGATVVFYAARGGEYARCRSAFQFHLAASDDFVSTSRLAKLRSRLEQAACPVEVHTYAGTRHWFCDQEQDEAYDAAAAALALERTETFLHTHLMPDAGATAIA